MIWAGAFIIGSRWEDVARSIMHVGRKGEAKFHPTSRPDRGHAAPSPAAFVALRVDLIVSRRQAPRARSMQVHDSAAEVPFAPSHSIPVTLCISVTGNSVG